jgi:t-SNARE complex subunit (syntaxin)
MDDDRVLRLLSEIRDLQRQQVEAAHQVLQNQQDAIRAQRDGMARARRLLPVLAIVVAIILVIVLVLLRFVLRRYA